MISKRSEKISETMRKKKKAKHYERRKNDEQFEKITNPVT